MQTTPGKLIGVSLGPGDPDLITRAAWTQLQRRDTRWVYPVRSGKSDGYAHGIVQRAGIEPVAHVEPIVFPMTYDAEKLGRAWLKAADTVLPWLQAGEDVLFLVEGDASTYSTFSHLARTVRGIDARIETPIIAGVNSYTAAASVASTTLGEQDDTIAVVPAAYGVTMLERLLPDFDTLVLMKIKPQLNEIIDWLQARHLLADAHFIEKAGVEGERVVSGEALLSLRDEKVAYLSLMIVRSPHRVRGERIRGCLKKGPMQTQAEQAEQAGRMMQTASGRTQGPETATMAGVPVSPGTAGPGTVPGSAIPAAADESGQGHECGGPAAAVAPHAGEPRLVLLAITRGGAAHAARLAAMLPQATLCTSQKLAATFDALPNPKLIYTGALKDRIGEIFGTFDQLICFVSAGAIVRLVAPHLKGKETDPGVIAVDDAARFVVPLLSGHVGGANEWAERVAGLLGATPVLTTASDARGALAVDILGRHLGWTVEAPKINLTRVAAALVNEEPIAFVQEAGSRHWWTRSTPLPRHIEILDDMTAVRPGHHRALLLVTHRPVAEELWRQWPEHLIVYRPPEGQGPDDRPAPGHAAPKHEGGGS